MVFDNYCEKPSVKDMTYLRRVINPVAVPNELTMAP